MHLYQKDVSGGMIPFRLHLFDAYCCFAHSNRRRKLGRA